MGKWIAALIFLLASGGTPVASAQDDCTKEQIAAHEAGCADASSESADTQADQDQPGDEEQAQEPSGSCEDQEAEIRNRLAEVGAERAALDSEKPTILAEKQKLGEDRKALEDSQRQATEALNARLSDFAARVEASNAKIEAFMKRTDTGARYERERAELSKERAALDTERTELEAERVRVTKQVQDAVSAYNARAAGIDQDLQAWNRRNETANAELRKLEDERAAWVTNCSKPPPKDSFL